MMFATEATLMAARYQMATSLGGFRYQGREALRGFENTWGRRDQPSTPWSR